MSVPNAEVKARSALMIHLAKIAVAEGCGRFQWVVHCRECPCRTPI